jgi:hypothetical protein
MQDQINSRPCVRCKAFKPQTEFHKEKSRPDGLRLECKACKKLARKLRRQREADVPPDHRKCKRCKNATPLSEFRQRIVKAGRQKGQTRITTRCIGCCRLFEREDRQRNPEKYRARDRKRYLNNREQRRTAVYLYRIENPEKIRETRRKGWLKHKEKRSARHSEYWLANLDKLKAYARTWRKENPEKCRDLSNKRRARKLSAPGEYTQAEWKAI